MQNIAKLAEMANNIINQTTFAEQSGVEVTVIRDQLF
jgi:hypothetical protein